MKATVRLVLLTALRDRLFGGIFILLAVSTALAVFLGNAAISEQLQMIIVMAAAGGRFILVLGLTIFAAFHIQRLFETREVEAILSRAISRHQFVFAYWLGLVCIASVLLVSFAIAIAVIAGATVGVLLWAATVLVECWLVLAVVLFAGLILERATSAVLFTMGFYALARLMGFFVGIRAVSDRSLTNDVVSWGLDIVLLFIPRLDLFAQTRWIIYGPEHADYLFLGLQAFLFLGLVMAAAVFDLKRKQF